MDFNVYCVLDKVSGEYGEPWLSQHDTLAIRKFNYVMKNSPMVATDCSLYCIGTYSTSTGVVSSFDKPTFVCNYEE
ncbi:nonstructural protein [Peromfec virus RodF8_54]|uniref:Nonstructural protein n=1 Tax=Peromfec virus RodF8_54 TaxID=2929383 RepID=A0A976N1Z1_9VIRU|nr:nonstructural protein [Peromfec virus RodF8_54]